MYRLIIVVALAFALIACGGTSSTPTPSPAPTPAPSPAPSPGPAPAPSGSPSTPAVVTVAAGSTASGVDIAVVAPASATPPNARDLGVADLSGPASAFNTGATIRRGQTKRVVLFGPGLTGSMTVIVEGPTDIQVSNVQSIRATDNTPGVSFTAAVSGNAALGARSVVLQASNGDITTFTGGLEVVP